VTENSIDHRIAQWTVQAVARATATFAILQGANIVVGGRLRWSSEAYATALLLPGAPASGGVVLLLAGLATLVGSLLGRQAPVAAGLFSTGAWSGFFALAFLRAQTSSPTASSTAFWSYALIGLVSLILAMAYWRSRP
jgi:hypothetical protein